MMCKTECGMRMQKIASFAKNDSTEGILKWKGGAQMLETKTLRCVVLRFAVSSKSRLLRAPVAKLKFYSSIVPD